MLGLVNAEEVSALEHPQKAAPKKRREPPSRAAVLRWVLAAIACSGVLAYFPGACSAVFLALLVLLIPVGPLEKWLAQRAPRLRRIRTAAIAALFLLAACIAPRGAAEPAVPERVIEAGVQEETKTPAVDEPTQEQPTEPETPDTAPEPEVPSPAASDPAQEEPSPTQSETVYITQTGKKYHRAGCRHLQKSQIPISLDDAKAKGYSACKSCGG